MMKAPPAAPPPDGVPAPTPGSAFLRCYRERERARAVAALLSGSSLLVVGGPGLGKSALARFVAADLRGRGFPLALVSPRTAKQVMLELAAQLSLGVSALDGRTSSTAQLQDAVAEELARRPAFLLFDDAHRLPASPRHWLEGLLAEGRGLALFATHPPRRDIFLKLGRIELRPLDRGPIREIMREAADELGLQIDASRLSRLQERCGGNPMLARRVLREQHLGLDDTTPDHGEWIDGTPLLIARLLVFTVLRFVGRGLHAPDLYLLGGVLTVGVVRLLIYSLPRQGSRIGQ